jgi:hypothetical protein
MQNGKEGQKDEGIQKQEAWKRNNESFAQIMMVKRIMEGNKYFFKKNVRTRKKISLVFFT